jgi:lipopolysaccharide export system permease protein
MSVLNPKLYFFYLSKLYTKNILFILFGLSCAFAAIDYFQYAQKLSVSGNYKILYIFYMWEQALGLLYPLSLIFALIMTKLALIRSNTMGALHAFGYDKKTLIWPFLFISVVIYSIFTLLHTTEFSYARDKGALLLKNEIDTYNVNNLFFKYNDTFVYINSLDPVAKKILDITIFKLKGHQVQYTIHAPIAIFDDIQWNAKDAIVKTHIYEKNKLVKYTIEYKEHIKTLVGYKPKIIESLYEGKTLNLIDAYHTWMLLEMQDLNSDKIRAAFYEKAIIPLFSISLLVILFFKLPFHARMMSTGSIIALSLGVTFIIWGILFGLNQIGTNGVLLPEMTSILPISLLGLYALYVYFTDEKSIH